MFEDIDLNLSQALLFSVADANGDCPALQVGDVSCSYSELARLVHLTSRRLRHNGIGPGDRVLIQLANSPEYLIGFFSIISVGAVAVPLDAGSSWERVEYVAMETHARILIGPRVPDNLSAKFLEMKVVCDLQSQREPECGGEGEILTCCPGGDRPAAILFSSGSTGRPKGVVLRHRHLLATARNLAGAAKLLKGHRELLLSPMCHTDGWQRVAATMLMAGCVIFFKGQLSVPKLISDIENYKVEGFYSPPPLVRFLLRTPADRIVGPADSLKSLEVGSAPISEPEILQLMTAFPKAQVLVHFGLTESSRATILDCKNHLDKLSSVGKAAPGVEIGIFGGHGERLAPGERGEIYLKGVQCADSYWLRPDLNASRFFEGWLMTGDYGALDTDGFLTYSGRKDDLINSGGFHFFPAEVETELGPVPGLIRYLVAGTADPQGVMGQITTLFAVPENSEWSAEVLYGFARKRLPAFMVPRRVVIVPEILTTSSGKPDRAKMVSIYG